MIKTSDAAFARGRPELLNRLDEVVVFRALGPADVRRIAELELAQVATRLAARGVRLEIAAAVRAQVCARGYDQVRSMRARPRGLFFTMDGDVFGRQVPEPVTGFRVSEV